MLLAEVDDYLGIVLVRFTEESNSYVHNIAVHAPHSYEEWILVLTYAPPHLNIISTQATRHIVACCMNYERGTNRRYSPSTL